MAVDRGTDSPSSGEAAPPGWTQRAVLLAALALVTAVPLFEEPAVRTALSAALTALWLLAVAARWRPLGPCLLLFALVGWLYRAPLMAAWPLPLVLALAACLAVYRTRGSLWLRAGRLDRAIAVGILGVVVISAGALLVWFLAARPDVTEFQRRIPDLSIWLLPLVGLAFSLVNAAAEEAVFRGVMQSGLATVLGSGGAALCLQALSFGLFHYRGFPSGAAGVVLAAAYGGMLGVLWRRADGMLAPWLAHVAADSVIFAILVFTLAPGK